MENNTRILKPSVFWCQGAYRGTVFDLNTARILKVPLGVIEVLKHIGRTPFCSENVIASFPERSDVVNSYLNRLETAGWLLTVSEHMRYRPLNTSPRRIRCVDNLYIEPEENLDSNWLGELSEFLRKRYRCRCLILCIPNIEPTQLRICKAYLDLARRVGFHQIGLWPKTFKNGVASEKLSGFDFLLGDSLEKYSENTRLARIPVPRMRIGSTSDLFCNLEDYRVALSRAYRTGNLFIDSNREAWPHPYDLGYSLGRATDIETLGQILGSAVWETYVSTDKNSVSKCRDCEYRDLCPNPLWFRERPADLTSPPENCDYDVIQGSWPTQSNPAPKNGLPDVSRMN